jgi:4-hydroxyproline epimerase
MGLPRQVRVIDSHTEGEPTRVVVEGTPELRSVAIAERVVELRREHDALRSGVICEPRGHDAVVGTYIFAPNDPEADHAVVFFNNGGYLGMCGHGTIGLVATLAHLDRLNPGTVLIETPAGVVKAELHQDGRVTVWNVRSGRYRSEVEVEIEGYGIVRGEVAYGGNWFFLTEDAPCPLEPRLIPELARFTTQIKEKLAQNGISGADGAEIDHIEVFGPPGRPDCHSKNFVLCPGLAYDRSPCGTGLSAKLACLAADGKLAPGEVWRQESIIGSMFEGSFDPAQEGGIWPAITGRAWITAESTLVFREGDPFREGISP